jgi:uncharacterized protein YcnI
VAWITCIGAALAGVLLALLPARPVAAHVLVTPTHSAYGAAELYTVTAQCERPVVTTRVELRIPPGVTVYSFAPTPGWQREIQVDGAGRVTGIVWSGGLILPQEFAQFGFFARNPARGSALIWNAIQTYQDGFAVSWTGATNSLQPAAVTVLGSTQGAPALPGGDTGTGDSSTLATVGLGVALLALALSLLCNGLLILVIRRRLL